MHMKSDFSAFFRISRKDSFSMFSNFVDCSRDSPDYWDGFVIFLTRISSLNFFVPSCTDFASLIKSVFRDNLKLYSIFIYLFDIWMHSFFSFMSWCHMSSRNIFNQFMNSTDLTSSFLFLANPIALVIQFPFLERPRPRPFSNLLW